MDLTFASLVKLRRDDLPQVYAAILAARRQKEQKAEDAALPQLEAIESSVPSLPLPPTPTMPEPKPQIRQSKLYAPDVEKMIAFMLRRGITGSPAEVFHAAIELLESEQLQQQQQQTVGEVAQTMNWFTSRIEKLENTIEQLHQERQQWQAQAGETQAIKQLQAEKEQLQQALEQTQSRLAAIEKLFGTETIERLVGAAPPIQATVPSPAPVEAPPASSTTASTPSVPAQNKEKATPPQPRRNANRRSREELAEEANRKVDEMIQAIISWNTSQDDSQHQIRISHKPLRALGRLIGANSQSRIEDGIKRHQAEIDEMHSQLGLGEFHNTQVKGKQDILRSIARENLGLENWQEVEWS